MIINANTKIAALLKLHPGALNAIVSLSPGFEKLRNPILRKLMAGRTSIAMAAKIGGCRPEDFFAVLKPLGFDSDAYRNEVNPEKKSLPHFLQTISSEQISALDVRPMLAEDNDPLSLILKAVKNMKAGHVLKIINTFEPTPLMNVLKKQGFESYADHIDAKLVETYFFKEQLKTTDEATEVKHASTDWEHTVQHYENELKRVDVRQMEMPLPMMTILEALETLPVHNALYVYHKRIPVFLLTELKERGFDFRIKEISDSEVHLIIFKN